jgi:ribosome-associated toxin RatA of RatAB toxin-antitoxin module
MKALSCALAAAALAAGDGSAPSVSFHREGGAFHVAGAFATAAPVETAWAVVSDYDKIQDFVSTMKRSRVVARSPEGVLIVEQEGKASYLFLSKTIKLTLAVREYRPERIDFEQVGGKPFPFYEGSWTIEPSPEGAIVRYDLVVEPGRAAGPGFVASRALPRNIERQLAEVRAEIERRRQEASP